MDGQSDELLKQRVYSMENMLKGHTDQILNLSNSCGTLKNDMVRISEMQRASGDKVRDIFNRHEKFEASQNDKFASMERVHKEIEASVRELHDIVNENTLQLAKDAGRHQEREKWTRILFSGLIIVSTLITGLTAYLK